MTTLAELNAAKALHEQRRKRAAELEHAADHIADAATRAPRSTLRDLYNDFTSNGYGRKPGQDYFWMIVDSARVAEMIQQQVEALVPAVMESVSRQLRAESVPLHNEADAAALLIRAALGADWNDKPKED
jgi:hypothetical protein